MSSVLWTSATKEYIYAFAARRAMGFVFGMMYVS